MSPLWVSSGNHDLAYSVWVNICTGHIILIWCYNKYMFCLKHLRNITLTTWQHIILQIYILVYVWDVYMTYYIDLMYHITRYGSFDMFTGHITLIWCIIVMYRWVNVTIDVSFVCHSHSTPSLQLSDTQSQSSMISCTQDRSVER